MPRRVKTVILANGDFPIKESPAGRLLASAQRVVCCDGAADEYLRRTGRIPDVVVGDLDSLVDPGAFAGAEIVRIAEQETNDLQKAARLCAERGWRNPVIVGATGKREDHAIGNVFRALDLGLEIVTDEGRFVPVDGVARLRVGKGAAISVFAPDPETRMTSRGLAWPLDNVRFDSLYRATLNRATTATVTLSASRRVLVYIASVSPTE